MFKPLFFQFVFGKLRRLHCKSAQAWRVHCPACRDEGSDQSEWTINSRRIAHAPWTRSCTGGKNAYNAFAACNDAISAIPSVIRSNSNDYKRLRPQRVQLLQGTSAAVVRLPATDLQSP